MVHTYDAQGQKASTTRYNADGSLASWFGKQVYSHDEKGNVTETARYTADGVLDKKWAYAYVYDTVGNWVKRTTSLWITKCGQSYFEPFIVTHRTITYYPKVKIP